MKGHLLLAAVVVVTLAVRAAQAQVVWYDSKGFETPTFRLGALNGQGGWISTQSGTGDFARVVKAPEPVLGGQAVRLEVGDSQGDMSDIKHAIADPLAAGWRIVIVTFDIYRAGPQQVQNLW